MSFVGSYGIYILGGIAIGFILLIMWMILDYFDKGKKLRDVLIHVIDSIFS